MDDGWMMDGWVCKAVMQGIWEMLDVQELKLLKMLDTLFLFKNL